MKTRKFHYAWVILIACCMLQVAGIGILSNTSASFITAVCSDRDLSFVNDAYEKSYTVKYDELVADGTLPALAEKYALNLAF